MSGLAVDPAVRITVCGALALLFMWAAAHKLRDVAGFRSVLASYEVLPAPWIRPAAVAVIVGEIGIAAAWCLPGLGAIPGLAAAGLLALYSAAIGINLRRGRRDIDCGCAGGAGAQPLSGALVLRNAVLCAAAVMSALPAAARSLTWLDAVTIIAGVTAFLLLYAAVDCLLANAPWLAALRRAHFAPRPARTPSVDHA